MPWKSMRPRPGDRKSQKRPSSPKFVCPPKTPGLGAALAPPDVLDVDVPDARAELAQEREVVDALVAEVARVEVESELRVIAERRERAAGRDDVERDLGRVDLEREDDVLALALGQDRAPCGGELRVAVLDLRLRDRREGVEEVPDRAPGEADDDGPPVRSFRYFATGSGAASKNFRAALTVSIISCVARLRTPSGLPSPQTRSGRIDLWRSSIGSQTACPRGGC
jgi:hypothetical protein